MKTEKQFFIGIDVSKPWFDASLMIVENHQKQPIISERFENSKTGIKAHEKWLKKLGVTFDDHSLLVVENTGIYHRLLWLFCSNHNLPIHIGNAAHIKWSFGIARGKNDKIDSIRLCQYAFKEADSIKATPALNPALLQLKDLMSARTRLINQRNSIKVALRELKLINDTRTQGVLEKAHKDVLKGLDTSIKSLEGEIKKIVADHADIKTNYDLLKTVPGIGHLTAIYLIGCTNNFICKITGKQLACYAGVVPFEQSSGISIKGRNRVHKMANKDLKKLLHLGALTVKRLYPEFTQYFERKKAEGKHTMSILNAIRNKIVLRAAAVINNQQPYVENPVFASQKFRKNYLEMS